MTEFNKFFSPASLAMLGASSDPDKWGYRILSNMINGGYKGRIYPINPKGGEILGQKVYRSMYDLEETPDLAVIVVPPAAIVEAVRGCVDKGIKCGVVITAGFAEIGERGVVLQNEMIRLAKEGGMRLVGPNCFGILNPHHKLYAQMPTIIPPAGPIAVVSQSGNVGATIARRTTALNFGLSRLISTGNEADLHAEDFMEFLGRDDDTRVILSYVEGFRDGRRFFEIARGVTSRKPLVMIKVGETEAGASAARSHTASLSGADNVFEGVCRQAGIVRVYNISQLLNVGTGFLCNPLPKGRRVGIVTIGGGWGVLAADACSKLGLEVAKLDDGVLKELDAYLPSWWSRNNPVDLVAGAEDSLIRSVEVLAKWGKTDSVISLGLPVPNMARLLNIGDEEVRKQRRLATIDYYEKMFRRMKEISERYDKPVVVATWLQISGPDMEREIMHRLAAINAVCYSMPDEAAMVLSAMVRYREYLERSGAL